MISENDDNINATSNKDIFIIFFNFKYFKMKNLFALLLIIPGCHAASGQVSVAYPHHRGCPSGTWTEVVYYRVRHLFMAPILRPM